jgi:hypothetical protein
MKLIANILQAFDCFGKNVVEFENLFNSLEVLLFQKFLVNYVTPDGILAK